MSVPIKNRKPNAMEYVKKGSDLYMKTVDTFSKVEKTYPEIVGSLKELANNYFVNAYMADKTYIDSTSTKEKFNMRQKYLDIAISSIYGYKAQLNLLFKIMKRGDSRLGNKKEMEGKFQRVADVVNEGCKLILGIKDSDKNRWEQWHPSKKQQNKNKDKADSLSKNKISTNLIGDEEDIHRIAEALRALKENK